MNIFIIYGIITLIFSALLSLITSIIEKKKELKLYKKHIAKRKKIFLFIAFFSLIIIWTEMAESFSETTRMIFWILNIACFIGWFGYSLQKFIQDKKRITAAQKRRMQKELLQK